MNIVRFTFILYTVLLYPIGLTGLEFHIPHILGSFISLTTIAALVLFPIHLFFLIYKYRIAKEDRFLPLYFAINFVTLVLVVSFFVGLLLFLSAWENS